MATRSVQSTTGSVWALARRQHGVVAKAQLEALGLSPGAIRHRLATGRLHLVMAGVYAVGRPDLEGRGRWMAAVLRCGRGAALSHATAASAWGIRTEAGPIEVSVPYARHPRERSLRIHRRTHLPQSEVTLRNNIPLTSAVLTLIDIAPRLSRIQLERAIDEADRLDLVTPTELAERLERSPGLRGVGALRTCLGRHSFVLADSELERRFLHLMRVSGMPRPLTRQRVNGFRVDFYWPELALVVETDGLRYHRTPAQQARDRRRDQAHARAGLTQLRFTHAQVRHQPEYVRLTLQQVMGRLRERGA